MTFLLTTKSLLLGLLLGLSFSSFILSIIDINKTITYTGTYPKAVVAFLVGSCLNMLYNLYLIAGGNRGRANRASIILMVQACFLAWYFAIAVTLTVKRWDPTYCPDDQIRVVSDCQGIVRALIALAWTDFGILTIWMSIVAAIASSYGGFDVPLGDLLPAEQLEARDVKEKSHS